MGKIIFLLWATIGVAWLDNRAWSAPAPKEPTPTPAPPAEVAAEPIKATGLQTARYRATSLNNLKQLAFAVHSYTAANNELLPRNLVDKNGKPLLSWRIRLLPYLDQEELFKRFKADEPWDSENNLKLLDAMPKVYSSPRVFVKKMGFTVYQGFDGKDTAFESSSRIKIGAIADGTSNTILMVESSAAVPWTKPVDLPFDEKKDLPDFGKSFDGKPLVSLCDGSVRVLDLKKIKAETLKNAITTADGNVLGDDW